MATTGNNDNASDLGNKTSSVSIPLGQTSSNNDNDLQNDASVRTPLTGHMKNMELYDVRLFIVVLIEIK